MKIVFCGLPISSWDNGYALTCRGLARELARRGNDLLFLECNQPRSRQSHGLAGEPPIGRLETCRDLTELRERFTGEIRAADAVIVSSCVPQGTSLCRWVTREAEGVTAFYDFDTPATWGRLASGMHDCLSPELVPEFDLYLSFTGGPLLRRIERELGSPRARALYCSADPEIFFPEKTAPIWELGYLGTCSFDRQEALERTLLATARLEPQSRFVVAGTQCPACDWGTNVQRIEYLPPGSHHAFYNSMRFTLNLTRSGMIRAGYSPSARLFEAAACGVPLLTDFWPGLETFFLPGEEILVVRESEDVRRALRLPAKEREGIAARARERVLAQHLAAHRALELERELEQCRHRPRAKGRRRAKRESEGQRRRRTRPSVFTAEDCFPATGAERKGERP